MEKKLLLKWSKTHYKIRKISYFRERKKKERKEEKKSLSRKLNQKWIT